MKTIYLAGPINGRDDESCKAWRRHVASNLGGDGWQFLDPMDRDYRGSEHLCASEIIRVDKWDIRVCSAVLACFDRPSFGTAMEIHYARMIRKPVCCVDLTGRPTSPWVLAHTDVVLPNLDDAIAWLRVNL